MNERLRENIELEAQKIQQRMEKLHVIELMADQIDFEAAVGNAVRFHVYEAEITLTHNHVCKTENEVAECWRDLESTLQRIVRKDSRVAIHDWVDSDSRREKKLGYGTKEIETPWGKITFHLHILRLA